MWEEGYKTFYPALSQWIKKSDKEGKPKLRQYTQYFIIDWKTLRNFVKEFSEILLHWINWKLSAVCYFIMITFVNFIGTLMIESQVSSNNLFMPYDVIAKPE